MKVSRREFFKIGSLGIMSLYLNACSGQFFKPERSSKGRVLFPCFDKGIVKIYDWDSGFTSEFPTPLQYTHSAAQGIQNKSEIFLFEEYGSTCAVFDLISKKIKKTIQLPPTEVFYGHGVISNDGMNLITTEHRTTSFDEKSGYLAVRNPSTLEKIYEIPSFGLRAHDICFLDHDTMAVSNHGNNNVLSNVSFISFSKKSLINRVRIEREWGHMGHIIPISKDEIFVSSVLSEMPQTKEIALLQELAKNKGQMGADAKVKLRRSLQWHPSPLYKVHKNGNIKKLWMEEKQGLFKNNFSICAISRREEIYASAHTRSHCVIVWKKWKPFKIIQFDNPLYPAAVAASVDGSELMVATAKGKVRFFSTENYEEIKENSLNLGSGPVHILSLK